MNRRQLLASSFRVGAALAVAPIIAPGRALAAPTITHVGYGGSGADFQRDVLAPLFTKETGINVQVTTGPDIAKVRAQVQADNIEWDVMETTGAMAYGGQKEGIWEAIDYKVIDPARFVSAPPSFAVPWFIYSDGIAYDPARTPKPAKTFAQLWDVKNFPGPRVMRNSANEYLEIALLADGVPPANIYPLDVDRAFRALDAIKPHVKQWAAQSQVPISMIQRNEAVYGVAGTNRVKFARDAGVSIDVSLEQNILGWVNLSVPKGSKNRQAAMTWIEFLTRPNIEAMTANMHGLTPAVKGVEQLLDPKIRPWMVDLKNPKNLLLSDAYWADNYLKLDKRFKEWILT